MSNRNSRRFGFGFAGPVHSSSNGASSTNNSANNADNSTPETNRRHSLGKLPSQSNQLAKGSPSPNRNSMKIVKEPTTPSSGSKSSNVVAKVKSPPTGSTSPFHESGSVAPSTMTSTATQLISTNGVLTTEQSLIKVCVRIRPLLHDESSESIVWQWKEKTITPIPFHLRHATASSIMDYTMANPNASFAFDHLFSPEHTNHHIFEEVVRDIVTAGMNGYHGSVFTYGQTSSGKTFTMYGNPNQIGVINLAVQYCFDSINAFPEREFLLRVSYLEVYNEQVRDLLSVEPVPIKILFDPKLGTVLSGVKEHVVFNPQQVYQLIKQGEAHRHIGVTDMNAQSSRAHTLFKVIIESKERSNMKSSAVRVSTLNLVDLAGSENAKMTNSVGERAREAKFINQSLLTLSTIIQRLSEEHQKHGNSHGKASSQHLPYRDSKLTRLLETALDGNARIAIVCNISPTSRCMEESVNTLKFGTRAKLIRINAKINENVDDKTLLRAYREEIEQLKLRLKELEEKHSNPPVAAVSETQAKTSNPVTPTTRKERSRSNDDNQSIEVTSATKIDIEETIHQIEDKIMQTSHLSGAEDDQQKMLQMIEAMERLILKADNSKQRNRKVMGVSSSETLNDPHERSMRLKGPAEGITSIVYDVEMKKSFRKAPSFSTGIPISTSHRTGIPRRANPQISRSNSNDNKSLTSLDIILESNDNDSTKSAGSGDISPGKISSKVLSPKLGTKPSKKTVVSATSPSGKVKREETIPVISSGSFERVILSEEKARDHHLDAYADRHQIVPEHHFEENNKDTDDQFPALKRQSSIPLADLQRNFTKLETAAERVGVDTSLLHHEREKADAKSASGDLGGTENRLGSISPLTMCTDADQDISNQKAVSNDLLPSSAAPAVKPIALPAPIETANLNDSGAFVFSPSATINRGNLPPPSPYENHVLSGNSGGMTPMKNRILRRVKDDSIPSNVNNSTSFDHEASAMEKMRQLAISNDTLDSFQSSIDPRFAAPNDVLTEDDSVLLGVSRMLTMLKDYISNGKQRPLPLGPSETNTIAKPSTTALSSKTANTEAQSIGEVSQPSQSNSSVGNPKQRRQEGFVSRDEFETLKQDLALKEADNHFLQEELEQKDKMLGMLTEGLKEVQESQMQWLNANQDLSQELEKTLLVNQILRNEITRLNQILSEVTASQSLSNGAEANREGIADASVASSSQQFISEEVALLLASPIAATRPVSHNQHLYLSRSRPIPASNTKTPAKANPQHSSGLSPLVTTTGDAVEPSTPYFSQSKDIDSQRKDDEPLVDENNGLEKVEKTSDETITAEAPPRAVSPPVEPSSPPTTPKQPNSNVQQQVMIDTPMSVSSTATTTIASPDVVQLSLWQQNRREEESSVTNGSFAETNGLSESNDPQNLTEEAEEKSEESIHEDHSPGVHIPPNANNVLDWKQSPMDFTNLHSEKECIEYFGDESELVPKEEGHRELQPEVSETGRERGAEGSDTERDEGEEAFREIPSPAREARKSPLPPASPSSPLRLEAALSPESKRMSISNASADREDASVIVHVEKIYQSCDSTESFGSIKESW